jgi:hypothetical protein
MKKNKTKRLVRKISKLQGSLDAALGIPAKSNNRAYVNGYGKIYAQGEAESARTAEF